jgi:hypothetical protein
MKYSGEFKTIDTQEKAYFLGQCYGDGYNGIDVRYGRTYYKFSIASLNTDKPIYAKLAEEFPFLKLKTYPSHQNMIYLECHCKEFCIDLRNLGFISNKTKKDATGEFHFPKISKDLLPHFIRGYFDADGSAWYPKRYRSRNNLHIEFSCNTPNFLNQLSIVLKQVGLDFSKYQRKKKAGFDEKLYQSYGIFSSNKELSKRFADYIYKNATLYLQYKYDKCYRKPLDIPPTTFEIYGSCPYCNGNHIWRSSIRHNKSGDKIRLKCRDCYRSFSVPMPTSEVTQNE